MNYTMVSSRPPVNIEDGQQLPCEGDEMATKSTGTEELNELRLLVVHDW